MKQFQLSVNPKHAGQILKTLLPRVNFISLHYTYFIVTILISSLIIWKTSTTEPAFHYIDCLFMVASAMTLTGLASINMSQMNTFQQAYIFVLMIAGNAVLVSYLVVLVRKRAFEKRFTQITEEYHRERERRGPSLARRSVHLIGRLTSQSVKPHNNIRQEDVIRPRSIFDASRPSAAANEEDFELESRYSVHRRPSDLSDNRDHNGKRRKSTSAVLSVFRLGVLISEMNPETHSEGLSTDTSNRSERHPHRPVDAERNNSYLTIDCEDPSARSSVRYTNPHSGPLEGVDAHTTTRIPDSITEILERAIVGHNSQFHGLSRQDRTILGGVEYRALRFLSYIIPAYLIAFQVVGCLSTALYIGFRGRNEAGLYSVNPWWLGIFLGVSSFSNTGLSLLDSGMTPFADSSYLLLTLSFLIISGNTAYPIILRFLLWVTYRLLPRQGARQLKETMSFLLTYPRRVYTNLFPAAHTWWLLFALVVLSAVDWIAFEALNRNNTVVTSISNPFRQEVGFFQSVSIRSAGFNVVSVSNLAIGNQFLIVIMMYISIFPVLIPLRSSNVYEERSLGIFADDVKKSEDSEKQPLNDNSSTSSATIKRTRWYFMQQQVRSQLAHDLWWLTLATFAIVCIEVSSYNADSKTYAVFNAIFEVVSAYGPVGLSTGLSDQAYSLSGGFHKLSKLVIIATMIRGRHRGLPVAIDRAVLLPAERKEPNEDETCGVRHLEVEPFGPRDDRRREGILFQ